MSNKKIIVQKGSIEAPWEVVFSNNFTSGLLRKGKTDYVNIRQNEKGADEASVKDTRQAHPVLGAHPTRPALLVMLAGLASHIMDGRSSLYWLMTNVASYPRMTETPLLDTYFGQMTWFYLLNPKTELQILLYSNNVWILQKNVNWS